MGKLAAVMGREFGERVRSRWFLLTTIFGPFLFAAFTLGPPWLAFRTARSVDLSAVVLVDATGRNAGAGVATELSGGLMGTARAPAVIITDATAATRTLDSLRREVAANRLPGVAYLSANAIESGAVTVLLTSSAPIATSERLEEAITRELLRQRVSAAGLDAESALKLAKVRVSMTVERVMRDGRSGSAQVNLLFGAGVAVLLYLVLVLYGQIVLRSVTEEKQSRVSELVLASVSPRILLSGKVIGIGGVALVQLGFWTVSVVALLANRGRLLAMVGVASTSMALPSVSWTDAVPLLAYFVLGYALYAALFAAVGSIVSSEQEAQQAQTPIIMLLVGSVALLQPALADPNGPIARTLSLVPFSSPIIMPLRLGLVSVPMTELALSLGLLALLAAGLLIAAGRLYRTALLMYGKRPSIREIVRWIRLDG